MKRLMMKRDSHRTTARGDKEDTMKFGELKQVINRNPGRHEWVAVTIGLGTDAVISADSPILDLLDDYEVSWIAPSTFGENTVTDRDEPCLDVHLKEKQLKPDAKVEDGDKEVRA